MVKTFFSFTLILLLFSCKQEIPQSVTENIQSVDSLRIIPYPQQVEKGEGYFIMNEQVHFFSTENLWHELGLIIVSFYDTCSKTTKVNIQGKPTARTCHILIDSTFETPGNHPGAYELEITKKSVTLTAANKAGIRYGINTLLQLKDEPVKTSESTFNYYLPAVKITDYPRFKHRGLLLDVCRHYFDSQVITKYLDVMEVYKLNVLHLHLTEDQGWRMPIAKYPLLNEISSWRLDTNGNKYGGYYEKEELISLVKYATECNITIIPEIELPGHSQAALAAYPQFSCNGEPIEVVNDWGVFKEIYCAGNDSTFTFLEDVLTEVMEVFPSEYIHIGGDEAPKFRWENCEKCQKRMKDEGLKDEHELQSYFIKRIEKFLNDNGRKLIGWDEILEGGLSPNAAVQSWRGMDGGKQAAAEKHEVIMSPTSHCYLDYGLSSIDLQKIYSFDPIPKDLEKTYHPYIIGGEGNMWTEHVPDEATLDAKVFPRLIGLAEVLWTYPKERNFEHFYYRLQHHYPRLKEWHNIDYGLETIGVSITQEFTDSGVFIVLNKNLTDLDLGYHWVGERNHGMYTPYTSPIKLDRSSTLLIQAKKNGEAYGEPLEQRFFNHEGINSKVTYTNQWSEWYTGNAEKNLVDGKLGSIDFRDGNWQGFWGEDIDVIIDLGEVTDIKAIYTQFYQYANSWIFLPKKITIRLSRDNKYWYDSGEYTNNEIDLSNQKEVRFIGIELAPDPAKAEGPAQARYIRFKAKGIGKVPDGHEAAGQDSWLFIDEIIVNGF